MKRLGLYGKDDPHCSFSQLDEAYACQRWHEECYWFGREAHGESADWGRIGHDAIAEVNRALKDAGSNGIQAEDIESAKRKLIGFRDYHLYSTFCGWMERYAEQANSERAGILGVELEVECWVRIGKIKRNPRRVWILDLPSGKWVKGTSKDAAVKLKGRIDRLDRGSHPQSCAITDFKLFGAIPQAEDVKRSFQLGLYSLALRQKDNCEKYDLNPAQPYEGKISSIFHNRPASAVLDLKAAEDAERCARDLLVRMIEKTDRPETFHRRCYYCPRSEKMRCRTFRDEITGAGVATKVLTASAGQYLKLGDRIAVMAALKENMRGKLRVRLEAYGRKPIHEDGAVAELHDTAGGKLPPGTDGFTTAEEWHEWALSESETWISVRRER
jgi:hypothetical protein